MLRGGLLGRVFIVLTWQGHEQGESNYMSNDTSDLRDILRQALMCSVLLPAIINLCVMCVELVLESDAQRLTH